MLSIALRSLVVSALFASSLALSVQDAKDAEKHVLGAETPEPRHPTGAKLEGVQGSTEDYCVMQNGPDAAHPCRCCCGGSGKMWPTGPTQGSCDDEYCGKGMPPTVNYCPDEGCDDKRRCMACANLCRYMGMGDGYCIGVNQTIDEKDPGSWLCTGTYPNGYPPR